MDGKTHPIDGSPAVMDVAIIGCGTVCTPAQQTVTATGTVVRVDWTQSYDAGHTDGNGAYAGGSEIMYLAVHKGDGHRSK